MAEAVGPGARGTALRAPALATAASLCGLVAAEALVPGAFAAHGTAAALAVIVLLGLPHGVLDIRAVRAGFRLGGRATAWVLGLYLALAAATGALWLAAPVAALLAFLALATVHFAEDWQTPGIGALGLAVPLALFSAGAARDRGAYDTIFAAMTGSDAAAVATDILLALGPLAHAAALLAAVLMMRRGEGWRALAAVSCVSAMWLLPPVAGFAVYFAVFHSPLHLREVIASIAPRSRWAALEGAATFGAALILVLALATVMEAAPGFPAVGSAVFVALALLTVPHMIVPRIVGAVVAARAPVVVELAPHEFRA